MDGRQKKQGATNNKTRIKEKNWKATTNQRVTCYQAGSLPRFPWIHQTHKGTAKCKKLKALEWAAYRRGPNMFS